MAQIKIIDHNYKNKDSLIQGIKALRGVIGVGLKEAKEAMDILLSRGEVELTVEGSGPALVESFTKHGFKISIMIDEDYRKIGDHIKRAMKVALEIEDLSFLTELTEHFRKARSRSGG